MHKVGILSRFRGRRRRWLAWGLGGLFAFLAIRQTRFDLLVAAFRTVDLGQICIALLLSFLIFALTAARWRLLFEEADRPSLQRFVEALFVAQLLNSALPARSGVFGRAHFISRGRDFDTSYALGTVFAEKLIEMVSLVPIFIWFLPSLTVLVGGSGGLGMSMLGLLVVAVGTVLVWRCGDRIKDLSDIITRIPFSQRLGLTDIVGSTADGVTSLGRSARNPRIWGLSALIWLTTVLMYVATLNALHIGVPVTAVWVLLVLLQIGVRVPALPAGIGVFHYLTILGLTPFSVDQTTALSAGIVLHALVFIVPSLVGLFILWRQ